MRVCWWIWGNNTLLRCTALKVLIELRLEYESPAMIYQVNGAAAPWIRYAEWLLTCPVRSSERLGVISEALSMWNCTSYVVQVILIHLSNLTGLKGEYSRRTMFLLVSDLGTIVWGVSAANATGAAKAIFFCVGLIYGSNTFYNAARVYIEAFHTVPKGICRNLVMALAWMFFASWGMFPLGFVAGMTALFVRTCSISDSQ